MKIGAGPYMNPETTTGGVALKFYASVRLEVRHGAHLKMSAPNHKLSELVPK